jgi:hypothetical protein
MESVVYKGVMDGILEIDANGQIWRIKPRRRRAEHALPAGYFQVRLMVEGIRHHALAHRLVWIHFRGPIPAGMQINHKNGNKTDNRLRNLEVMTPSENARHATRVLRVGRCANQNGEANHAAKLTEQQVTEIRRRRATGERLKSIAKDFGVSDRAVSKIALGQRWAS